MADSAVLKEFLVKLGYQVDSSAQQKFTRGLEAATNAAVEMGKAVTALSVGVLAASTKLGQSLDELYAQAQRTQTSAQSIRAMGYAVSMLGGSYREAIGSIDAFSAKMRQNPGYVSLVEQLGVRTKENGKIRETAAIISDLGKALQKQPYHVAFQYGQALGFDENTFRALMSGEFGKHLADYNAKSKKMGVNTEAATQAGKRYEDAMRGLQATFQLVSDKLAIELLPRVEKFIQQVDEYLQSHSDQILDAFKTLGRVAEELGKAFSAVVAALTPLWEWFDKTAKALTGQAGLTVAIETLIALKLGKWLLGVAKGLGAVSAAGAGGLGVLSRLGGLLKLFGVANAGAYAAMDTYDYYKDPKGYMEKAEKNVVEGLNKGSEPDKGGGFIRRGLKKIGEKLGFGDKEGANPSRTIDQTAPGATANHMRGQYGAPGENLTTISTPSGKKFTVHKAVAASFQGLVNELEGMGYQIGSIGGYANRAQANGSGRISQHAYGNAIDINPGKNPYKTSQTDMPANVSEIARKWGLTWGGDWSTRYRDPMHFEWTGRSPEAKRAAMAGVAAGANAASKRDVQPGTPWKGPFGVGVPPLSFEGGSNVNMTQKTEIHVNGNADPAAVGSAVADAQKGVNGGLVRNMQGAVR